MNMDTIMNFLADNYKWFMIGAGVLLLALIGFIVSGKKKKNNDSSGITMNQNDFNQMGTLQQAQPAIQQVQQSIQSTEPAQAVSQTPQTAAPTLDAFVPQSNVDVAANNDTIFTGAPVNAEEEKLVIEAPTGTLNENVNMDAIGIDTATTQMSPELQPVTEVPNQLQDNTVNASPIVEAPTIEAAPQMQAQPVMESIVTNEPVVEEIPAMQSVPANEIPISMTPEEPIVQAPQAPVIQETVIQEPTPVAPAPVYQNTIQQ